MRNKGETLDIISELVFLGELKGKDAQREHSLQARLRLWSWTDRAFPFYNTRIQEIEVLLAPCELIFYFHLKSLRFTIKLRLFWPEGFPNTKLIFSAITIILNASIIDPFL